jgi:hypothetical protein
MLNRTGRPIFLGKRENSAVFYCGLRSKLIKSGDGCCGPDNGEQCENCIGLNVYSIVSQDEEKPV